MPSAYKRCGRCKRTKRDKLFYVIKGKLSSYCKCCTKKYLGSEKTAIVRRDRYRKTRAKIKEYLQNHPCVDCGESDPIVLEFDHVKGKKEFEIADFNSRKLGKYTKRNY